MLKQLYESLTEKEKEIFGYYKNSSYQLNEALFRDEVSVHLERINQLDLLIQKDENSNQLTLFRATDDAWLKNFIDGETNIIKTFLSTCDNIGSVVRHFSGSLLGNPTIMIINCPIGTNMISLDADIFGIPENEILLGRGHKFVIIKNEIIHDSSQIEQYMGKFYASGVNNFRIMELNLIS